MIKILEVIIPGEDKTISKDLLIELDEALITDYPEAAFNQVKDNTIGMYSLAIDSLQHSKNYLNTTNKDDYEFVMEIEEIINQEDFNTTKYLTKLAKAGFRREDEALIYSKDLNTIKNIERISDLSVNLIKFYKIAFDNNENFNSQAIEDINQMYDHLINLCRRSKNILINENKNEYKDLMSDESYLDLIESKYRDRHFNRITSGVDEMNIASSLIVDILGTLERIGDHSVNIARNIFYPVKER